MKVINIGKHFISNSNIYSYKLHRSSSKFRTHSFEINSLWMKHYHGERLALAASRRRSSVLQCPNQYGVVLCCPGSLLCTNCTDFSLNSQTVLWTDFALQVRVFICSTDSDAIHKYSKQPFNCHVKGHLEVICALSCIRWPQKTCQISSGYDRTSKQICPRKTSYEILSRFRNTQICYLQIDKLIYPNIVFYKY